MKGLNSPVWQVMTVFTIYIYIIQSVNRCVRCPQHTPYMSASSRLKVKGGNKVACKHAINVAEIVRLLVMQNHPGPAKTQELQQVCIRVIPVHLMAVLLQVWQWIAGVPGSHLRRASAVLSAWLQPHSGRSYLQHHAHPAFPAAMCTRLYASGCTH